MRSEGPFRGLSLDLWFTVCYHVTDDPETWASARQEVLARFLSRPNGRPLEAREITEATRAVEGRLRTPWSVGVTTPPARLVAEIADRLGAVVTGAEGEAGRAYSAAGLADHPPQTNPDAAALVNGLAARGIPAILVTNSARTSETWRQFLAAEGRPRFRDVVSSADFGRAKPDPEIFREASRRLGLLPSQVLHVGDRWELDVAGAIAAGCGAALYRGLWDRYPAEMYPPDRGTPPEHAGVPVLDRLDALLDPRYWEASPARAGAVR
jgi:HAD superfamily hydrolase (TIGR01509 family)